MGQVRGRGSMVGFCGIISRHNLIDILLSCFRIHFVLAYLSSHKNFYAEKMRNILILSKNFLEESKWLAKQICQQICIKNHKSQISMNSTMKHFQIKDYSVVDDNSFFFLSMIYLTHMKHAWCDFRYDVWNQK